MLYMVPGAVAGLVVSLILVLLNRILAWFSSDRLRLSAHARLIIFCLAVVAYSFLLIVRDGGGNWATQYQVAGFLLVECLLTTITAVNEHRPRAERAACRHPTGAASD